MTTSDIILKIESLDPLKLDFPNSFYDTHRTKEFLEEIWSNLNFFKITYRSQGHTVVGFIAEPKSGDILPCIVYNRGGSGEYGVIEEHQLYKRIAMMASWGYIVIASQYSGNGGSDGKDEGGGTEIEDVLIFKDILDNYSRADSSKIGMYGQSRGGMMTYIALSKANWISAAVIKAGTSDLYRSLHSQRPDIIMFREAKAKLFDIENPEEIYKRSPKLWVDKFCKTTPILIMHGTADSEVSCLDALEVSIQLQNLGYTYRTIIYDNDNHSLKLNFDESNNQTKSWFGKYLKNKVETD